MNKTLETMARDYLKSLLAKCSEPEKLVFRRMYSHRELNKNIDAVVDDMPTDKLDWAVQQVEKTLERRTVSSSLSNNSRS